MPSQGAAAPRSIVREHRKEQFLITTEPPRLDVDSIHGFLSKESWDSEGIARDVVERSIRGSLCFGVYDGQRQIGFARVGTDGATLGYLCDDYILEDYGGKALGKWLMECILSHADLLGACTAGWWSRGIFGSIQRPGLRPWRSRKRTWKW